MKTTMGNLANNEIEELALINMLGIFSAVVLGALAYG